MKSDIVYHHVGQIDLVNITMISVYHLINKMLKL